VVSSDFLSGLLFGLHMDEIGNIPPGHSPVDCWNLNIKSFLEA
jgi:hypothetical protein